MADYEEEPREREEQPERSRSMSPERYDDRRSVSPNPERESREWERDDRGEPMDKSDEEESKNEGTNLFVTGLSRGVTETELEDLFTQYGAVDKCQIMLDPHTRESRGFGFVNMQDVEGADSAIKELNGYMLAGKTLSLEKAKRKRPRTPTPGKYFGPPKPRRGRGPPRHYDDRYRGDRYRDFRGPPPQSSRYEGDRRAGGYSEGGYYSRRPRYDDRDSRDRYYRDRSYGGRFEDRERERERYPAPREYRDRGYDRRDSREERLPPREERLPPREERLPPRDEPRAPPYREDRYAPPPAGEFRDREDYR
ncbi:hypothetical protein TRVA0_004S02762 [Trichomonascus vanleenenianus]|uniref:RNA recognition motif domain-containing protein n=1 Tax=Trichomonascus vanleenenianus TaxID=2268995 RepID=UPI003ECA6771